jgi:hypothetical protein
MNAVDPTPIAVPPPAIPMPPIALENPAPANAPVTTDVAPFCADVMTLLFQVMLDGDRKNYIFSYPNRDRELKEIQEYISKRHPHFRKDCTLKVIATCVGEICFFNKLLLHYFT